MLGIRSLLEQCSTRGSQAASNSEDAKEQDLEQGCNA